MKDFTNILVAALIVALVPHPGDAAVPECPADGTEACYDCTTKGDCSGTPGTVAAPGAACATGEACKVVGGVATCMPVAEVAGCGCGSGLQGCDAYNADQQIFCIPAGAGTNLFKGTVCDPANNEACSEGQCVPKEQTADTCTGKTTTGFYPVAPTCTSGAFCFQEKEQYKDTCKSGEYFNKAKAACEAFPPNPCTDCTKQKCPVISDCTKYAICSNGQVLDDDESCPAGELFNSDSEACEAGATPVGVCADYTDCEFESTARSARRSDDTTDEFTTANVYMSYPHETDCKKYYKCQLTPASTYECVEFTCPGLTVYNPTSKLCDDAANVPSCVVDP